jgi:hypothetical protein
MNLRYVQIEPGYYDNEMARLSDRAKGIYGPLTVHMLANDGWIKDDIETVAKVCGLNILEAKAGLELCKHLYVRRNGKIFHKYTRSALAEAKRRAQVNHIRAVTAREVQRYEPATSRLVADGKGKRETPSPYSQGIKAISPVPALTRARELNLIIPAKNSSDWQAYINLAEMFKGTPEQWQKVLEIAVRAKKKKHPPSYFFAVLGREMNYRRKSRGGTATLAASLKEIEKRALSGA